MDGKWLIVALTLVGATAQSTGFFPLLRDCGNPAERVATLQATDRVQVRYALGGDTQTCYAVSALVSGGKVDGYLLGTAHPDVAAFERESRIHVSQIIEPAKPAAETTKDNGGAKVPQSFAGLSGISPEGRRVSLGSLREPTVVVYFWSANDKNSVREASGMDGVYETYRGKGVALMGVVCGSSAAQARKVVKEEEVIWPQILDNGALAARYQANKGTRYFILDRSRNVVAGLKTSVEVQRELMKLSKRSGGSE
jgi:peroxiredoxin